MPVLRNMTTSMAASLVAGVLALSSTAGSLAAQRPGGSSAGTVRDYSTYAGGVSMDQAIQMAERQYGAKVVRASVSEDNGRRVYVLRLVSEQGRVWTVRVDAASGAMM